MSFTTSSSSITTAQNSWIRNGQNSGVAIGRRFSSLIAVNENKQNCVRQILRFSYLTRSRSSEQKQEACTLTLHIQRRTKVWKFRSAVIYICHVRCLRVHPIPETQIIEMYILSLTCIHTRKHSSMACPEIFVCAAL